MKLRLLSFVMLICCATSGSAATITYSFPSLVGNYVYPGQATPVAFDVGTQFSAISSATLQWTATGTPSQVQLCLIGAGCNTSSYGPSAQFYFSSEPGYSGAFGSLDLVNTSRNIAPTGVLLDGKGTLNFGHSLLTFAGIYQATFLQYSTFQVSNVTLTIEGTVTPVPVPAALSLLFSGLSGMLLLRRKRTPGQV